MTIDDELETDIARTVTRLLAEDVGDGDLTASLVPKSATAKAVIMTREDMVQAGRPWVDDVFRRLAADIEIEWNVKDGEFASAGSTLCRLRGSARALLTGERAALNLLQTLSATATTTARYVNAIEGTGCRILDTRKTLPGLRRAQKYAVACGGGSNHRVGLFDAILIKENHITSAGGIEAAVSTARDMHPGIAIEVEVENLSELEQALNANVERVLLDNFPLDTLEAAAQFNRSHATPAELEASGNVTLDTIRAIAVTGVDFVSVGALTKHVKAIDLSMRFEE